jgi:hypothetical protein
LADHGLDSVPGKGDASSTPSFPIQHTIVRSSSRPPFAHTQAARRRSVLPKHATSAASKQQGEREPRGRRRRAIPKHAASNPLLDLGFERVLGGSDGEQRCARGWRRIGRGGRSRERRADGGENTPRRRRLLQAGRVAHFYFAWVGGCVARGDLSYRFIDSNGIWRLDPPNWPPKETPRSGIGSHFHILIPRAPKQLNWRTEF